MKKRGIILIHLGQAGIQMGSSCWNLFAMEHGVLPNGCILEDQMRDDYKCLFDEATCGRVIPRSIFVDLKPNAIDELRNNQYKNLFHCDRMIYGKDGAASNYGRGYYTQGSEILPEIENKIRMVSEICESFSGFLIFHSVGGGTGSGLTALVMQKLSEEFPKKSSLEFVIFPSAKLANSIVEPYNGVLGMHNTIEHCECSFLLDNEAIYAICTNNLDLDQPSLTHLNQPIASVISSITSSLRFCGPLNSNLEEFQTNLVPFPRIHFPLTAFAPFISKENSFHKTLSILNITKDCLKKSNRLMNCDPQRGKYISCCFIYNGLVFPKDVTEAIETIKEPDTFRFVNWCPTSFKVGINYQPPRQISHVVNSVDSALCMLSNNTAIAESWARLSFKFDLMFAKRAYIHWYLAESMEMEEFVEAREDLAALECDYEECNKDII